jgi:hypothetical protein
MKVLMLMIRHSSGHIRRTKTYWTNGRIIRSHVDVRGVTDVTGHAEITMIDPIGGAYPPVLARPDEREKGAITASLNIYSMFSSVDEMTRSRWN